MRTLKTLCLFIEYSARDPGWTVRTTGNWPPCCVPPRSNGQTVLGTAAWQSAGSGMKRQGSASFERVPIVCWGQMGPPGMEIDMAHCPKLCVQLTANLPVSFLHSSSPISIVIRADGCMYIIGIALSRLESMRFVEAASCESQSAGSCLASNGMAIFLYSSAHFY